MGTYQSCYWQSDGWGMSRRETQSGTYRPYLPDLLCDREICLTPEAAAAVSRGESAVRMLDQDVRHLTDTEALARLILRSEALSSSRIEGLQMNAGKLLEYEALDDMGVPHRLDATEAAVIANINAMQDAVSAASACADLSLDDVRAINASLLAGTHMAERGGFLRTDQNWIGGNNVNPVGAAYVPPRPEYVPSLMDDLVAFCNTSALPPLAKAAVAHAQLETIHPFADGNGRTGRALVHVILRASGLTQHTLPPVSLVMATDKDRYINNLAAFRTDATLPDALTPNEALSDWVEYFSNLCVLACQKASAFEGRIAQIQEGWRERCRPRKNSAVDLLLSILPGSPVISVSSGVRLTGRSPEALRLALRDLESQGVLVQNAKNRKSSIYVAQEILDAFTAYERSLATPGGDTAVEKPVRAVPQRVPRGRRL